MNVDPYYQRQKCRSITIVSGNINHLQIFDGVSCRSVFKPGWGRWNRRICSFPVGIYSYVSEIASALIPHYDDTTFWIRAGTNKDDFECPVQVKVRFTDSKDALQAWRTYVVDFGAGDAWLDEHMGISCQRQKMWPMNCDFRAYEVCMNFYRSLLQRGVDKPELSR